MANKAVAAAAVSEVDRQFEQLIGVGSARNTLGGAGVVDSDGDAPEPRSDPPRGRRSSTPIDPDLDLAIGSLFIFSNMQHDCGF